MSEKSSKEIGKKTITISRLAPKPGSKEISPAGPTGS
jgi:hypothetical protein